MVALQVHSASASEAGATLFILVDGEAKECIDERRLASSLAVRATRLSEDATLRLRASVSREGSAVIVSISGTNARGPLEPREFRADTCDEAADALVLYAALSAETAEPSAPPTAPPPRRSVAPPASTAEPPVPIPFAPTFGLAVTASSLAEGQIGARLSFGAFAPRVVVPLLEASIELPIPRTVSGGGGDAEVFSARARATLVPAGFPLGTQGLVGPYVALEGGALFVSGRGPRLVRSQASATGTLACGGMVRLGLGGHFFIALSAGAVLPFPRDTFVFTNGGTAYQVPTLGIDGAIGVGMSFP